MFCSGGRGFAGSKKSSERKRLIVYGVYAFGMPLLLIVLIYVLDIYLPENSVHRPDVGRTKCFLSGKCSTSLVCSTFLVLSVTMTIDVYQSRRQKAFFVKGNWSSRIS